MYFSRMKRENRSGPKLLRKFPEPDKFSAGNLAGIIAENNAVIIDTRTWEEYKTGHIHGSIFAPLNNSFSTVTGSYITPDMFIYLIIDEKQLNEAVNGLIRIGLDKVLGFITPDDLLVYQKNDGELIESEEVSTSELKVHIILPIQDYIADLMKFQGIRL